MTYANSDNLFGLSPYIVDLNNTAYYPTIQSAINQAIVDGHGIAKPTVVFVRSGTYVEDVTLASGIFMQGVTDSDPFAPRVIISGSVTANAAAANFFSMQNFTINNPAGNSLILTGTVPIRFVAQDLNINVTAANAWGVDLNCNSGTFGIVLFYDCQISGDDYGVNIVNHNTLALNRTTVNANNLAAINVSDNSRLVCGYSILQGGSGSSIILNSVCTSLTSYSELTGPIFCNDTTVMTLHYTSVDAGAVEGITIAIGASCEAIANIIHSDAASGFWVTGTGTIATGGNNTLTGTAGLIDPATTITGFAAG